MATVGFKRATIGIHDPATGLVTSEHVIEGTQDKGATVSAEISGLSSEPVKVYGSNILYYVLQKGSGEVEVSLDLMDLPAEANDEILGYKKALDGFVFIGEDTEPPYCSLILESDTLAGEKVMLGMFKGKFSKESVSLATKEGDNVTPEPESYKFSAVASDRVGDSKGQTVAKYIGTEKAEAFKTLVMPVAGV